jgi:hypothetical protein
MGWRMDRSTTTEAREADGCVAPGPEAGAARRTWTAWLLRRVPLLPFAMMVLLMASWARQARRLFMTKDWVVYYDTASLLLAGRFQELYPGITPGLPFFYPPFFVWQVAPLGLVPRKLAYACVVVAMALATVIALWALRTALDPDRRRSLESWVWFVLSSAGWTWMIVCGHISAWYLMLLSVTLLLWARGWPIWAGITLSLASTKPHYAFVVVLFMMLARSWRIVMGATIGGALLAVSTYPLGWNTWRAWLGQTGSAASVVLAGSPAWKQITIRSFWAACLGTEHGWATALWIATAAPAAALASCAAWKSGQSPDRLPRVLGLGVLVALTCGPYAFHYDGLLLAVPALVWYFRFDSYQASWVRAGIGVMILATYVLQLLGAWFLQDRWPLTGLPITAWIVFEALDLSRSGTAGGGIAPVVADDVLARLA